MKKGEYDLYHTIEIMNESKVQEYVKKLIEIAKKRNVEVYNKKSGELTGYETHVTVDTVKATFENLSREEAEKVAEQFNLKLQKIAATRAANQFAKEGVTVEEIEFNEKKLGDNSHDKETGEAQR